MKCPKCENKEMELFKIEGVEFDFCCQDDGCLGLWCEKGELAFYTESITDLPFKTNLDSAKQSEVNCPNCHTEPLFSVQYEDGLSLELDYCKKCAGILIDKGELAKVEKSVSKIPLKERLKFMKEELSKKGFSSLS